MRPFWLDRPDDSLILLCGLWRWRDSGTGFLQKFPIITTPANAIAAPIHDRMPAIIEGALALWLNPKTRMEDLPELLKSSRVTCVTRSVPLLVEDGKNDAGLRGSVRSRWTC